LSKGSAAQATIASAAIPVAFVPVRHGDLYLADGAVSSNTAVKVAVAQGAQRLIVLPTGYACALDKPPAGAVGERAARIDAACRAAIVEGLDEPQEVETRRWPHVLGFHPEAVPHRDLVQPDIGPAVHPSESPSRTGTAPAERPMELARSRDRRDAGAPQRGCDYIAWPSGDRHAVPEKRRFCCLRFAAYGQKVSPSSIRCPRYQN
jgi:predicted acylesterase/phospholipase RssA